MKDKDGRTIISRMITGEMTEEQKKESKKKNEELRRRLDDGSIGPSFLATFFKNDFKHQDKIEKIKNELEKAKKDLEKPCENCGFVKN